MLARIHLRATEHLPQVGRFSGGHRRHPLHKAHHAVRVTAVHIECHCSRVRHRSDKLAHPCFGGHGKDMGEGALHRPGRGSVRPSPDPARLVQACHHALKAGQLISRASQSSADSGHVAAETRHRPLASLCGGAESDLHCRVAGPSPYPCQRARGGLRRHVERVEHNTAHQIPELPGQAEASHGVKRNVVRVLARSQAAAGLHQRSHAYSVHRHRLGSPWHPHLVVGGLHQVNIFTQHLGAHKIFQRAHDVAGVEEVAILILNAQNLLKRSSTQYLLQYATLVGGLRSQARLTQNVGAPGRPINSRCARRRTHRPPHFLHTAVCFRVIGGGGKLQAHT